ERPDRRDGFARGGATDPGRRIRAPDRWPDAGGGRRRRTDVDGYRTPCRRTPERDREEGGRPVRRARHHHGRARFPGIRDLTYGAVELSTWCHAVSSRFPSTSRASRFCTSCSAREAPSITVDTCGLRRHQAIASGAGATPSSFATLVKRRARSIRRSFGSPTTIFCSQPNPSRASRPSCCTPLLYLPVSSPEASGDQMVVPMPYSA